ncbi:unnamed protein product [Moneuplotes crassus]|uniref:Uncharacterized protein n=1 Tax=Euplotes crassus TaxID=5936 RepID=A0AAD1UAQ3_EUPCR|nr:unnamed protein product [Moneuplotes crassus]
MEDSQLDLSKQGQNLSQNKELIDKIKNTIGNNNNNQEKESQEETKDDQEDIDNNQPVHSDETKDDLNGLNKQPDDSKEESKDAKEESKEPEVLNKNPDNSPEVPEPPKKVDLEQIRAKINIMNRKRLAKSLLTFLKSNAERSLKEKLEQQKKQLHRKLWEQKAINIMTRKRLRRLLYHWQVIAAE